MAKHVMEMVLDYARAFEEDRDMGNDDNNAGRKIANHNGQCVVNGYFTDESQIKSLIASGVNEENLGHARFKDGDPELGIGKYMKIARLFDNVKTFKDKKGNEQEVDFGGAPKVIDYTQGEENKALWSYEDQGSLGKGTKAMVQFEDYGNGSGIRLIAIAVTDFVAPQENSSEEDAMFTV